MKSAPDNQPFMQTSAPEWAAGVGLFTIYFTLVAMGAGGGLGWMLTLPLLCLSAARWPGIAPLLPPAGLALSAVLYAVARQFGAPDAPLVPTVLIYLLLGWSALALLRPVTALREQLRAEQAQARRDARTLQAMADLAGLSARTDLDAAQATSGAARVLSRALDVQLLALCLSRPGQPATVQVLHGPSSALPGDLVNRGTLGQTPLDRRPSYVNAGAATPLGHGGPGLELPATAVLPLGTEGGERISLLVVGGPRLTRWGVNDRALLETAAGAVTQAANHQYQLRRLETLAHHDALTGCLNRYAFGRTMAGLDHAPRRGYALALLDLNGFKALNDREGHARGDEILQAFADALRRSFFERDSLFRLGGDEFALALRDVPERDLPVVAAKICEATSASAVLRAAGVSVSVGLAHAGQAPHAEGVLALADGRMYAAKGRRKAGRGVMS